VAAQVARSRELLAQGAPLVARLHGWARVAVSGYVAGGLATADSLEAATYDVLGRDVRPSSRRTAAHALRLWAGRGAS
jgi:phytoene/squalene synthetase